MKQETVLGWIKEIKRCYPVHATVMNWVRIVAAFLTFLHNREIILESPLDLLKTQYPVRGLNGIVLALLSLNPEKSLQRLRAPDRFGSPLGKCMLDFIKLGRAQGKKYKTEEDVLFRFDQFLMTFDIPPPQLSVSIIKKWILQSSKTKPVTRYTNLGIIRRFCVYLRRFDPEAYLPDLSLVPVRIHSKPYIYSETEIKALLRAASQLKASPHSPLRPQVFHLLIVLLYTSGLRIGEALKLRLCDIDMKNGGIYIRETKFFKSRMVILSPSMMNELKNFIFLSTRENGRNPPDTYLFRNPRLKTHYSPALIWSMFRSLLVSAEIKKSKGYGPRIHDLRHTMAVHRLERWYREGENVQAKLGLLSTYLGHSNVSGTQVYLTMTPELLEHASCRFSEYFNVGEQK